MVTRIKDFGMDALALTDHGVMYGVLKFYLAAKEAGIKPIIGEEAYIASRSRFDKDAEVDSEQRHLILLAKDNEGYKNLLKLTTLAHLEGFYYKPRIDKEILKTYSKGLIGTSACLQGEIPQLLLLDQEKKAREKALEYMDIFGEGNFYIELQKHPKIPEVEIVNDRLISLAKDLGLPLVATNDSHYVSLEDSEAQEVLLCVQTQTFLSDQNRKLTMLASPDFYLRSQEEMKGLFIQYPEAIENTVKIAGLCEVEIETGKWVLPHFPVPEGETPNSYFKKLTYEKIPSRYDKMTNEIKTRLEYELDVIIRKGYATYFLIVADFVNWAKNQSIAVGPGRGSAAGSLVAYSLGITEVDPIKLQLPFERFLNPQRPTPPDIDLDFADDRRDEVIKYVTEKYGSDKVAQIITFGTMEARQAVRDVGRVLGMPYAIPDRVAKLIPLGSQGFHMTLDRALEITPELMQLYQTDPQIKRLIDLARKLEGVARHASTHAAGIVIADKPLTEYVPLQREVKGERIITQYDMYSLDLNISDKAIGLLKMDFLGLRNLTILQKTIEFVKKTKGKDVSLKEIPEDDREVFNMIAQGETTGVFQLESGGMRRLARELRPNKFSDISAMVALYRPGPMDWINDFIAAKRNVRQIKYIHSDLKPILEETYGIAVYQEQCMQIANVMAGYTLVEADNLRRAIGKKKPELMKKEKEKFIAGCVKQGYKQAIAERVWGLIEKFVGYGFNKPHSASYALIAYQTAYMKYHYPVEFMTAVLAAESRGSSGPARDEKIAQAIAECRRMKIIVLPPDVNASDVDFTIENEKIRFGLSAIKNVGTAAIEAILTARNIGPFESLADFVSRVDLQKVNKKTLESLIKSGAMDEFGKRAAMLSILSEMIEEGHRQKKQTTSGQTSLFPEGEDNGNTATNKFSPPDVEEFTRGELLSFEREFLGFYLTEHPLTPVLSKISVKVSHKIGEINLEEDLGKSVKIGGIISQVRHTITKNGGNEMAFCRVEDETGSIEAIIFPRIFSQSRIFWVPDRIVLASGKIDNRDEKLSLIVDSVEEFNQNSQAANVPPLQSDRHEKKITIPIGTKPEVLKFLSGLLSKNPGPDELILVFENKNGERRIKLPYTINLDNKLQEKIKELLGF
jgi:DNA polymerase-3 subunit alpha